jgi:multiple sugar transport system ATP-binding protein
MGSEYYAHFSVDAKREELGASEELRDLAEDAGGEAPGSGGFDVVARLDQTSGARPKAETEIWVNTEKIQLFDADSGKNLTVA